MSDIALYGLGEMGADIARCLVGREAVLHAYDPVAEVDLKAPNFHRHTTAEKAARAASAHLVVVKRLQDVEALLFADSGLCASAPPRSLVVLHTTLIPDTVRELRERVSGTYGHTLLDAALSRRGGPVREGSLSLFVGGEEAEVAAARPTLELYADNVVHTGPTGAGMTVKLCNNWLLYSNRHAALQAIRTARQLGVDHDVLLRALTSSTGSSWALNHYSELDEAIVTGQGAPPVMRERTTSELRMARDMASTTGKVPTSLQEAFAMLDAM
ncbi:NAD(P)-binding domain-containing protein [Streptomyces sp. NBC_01433]|uniref:NAD(P)-dependent oxidoreductase n=1 Tax=Streptomyces sp. NBC_01433 TaxID=2903864 RepID=UPI00225258D1|nr:NAD(P)-binding domain-containing protein [Streptomyces sp. NBC_01433]MCX4681290.1 NAD(P)-binding domain-containing protein [Streptomyces sp. NBC_01433]